MSLRKRTLLTGALGFAIAHALACSGAQNGQAASESAPPARGAGDSEAPGAAPHGKRAPCSSDQSCNEDPAVSALWGRCTEMGICECNPGFERSPTSDLCRPAQ
jgi:hypothetical protein